jgi:hypothetical protein
VFAADAHYTEPETPDAVLDEHSDVPQRLASAGLLACLASGEESRNHAAFAPRQAAPQAPS